MTLNYNYYDPKYIPEAFGFNNTGSICWGNSIFQLLISCSAMNKALLENQLEFQNSEFAIEYIEFLKAIIPNKTPSNPQKLATASANLIAKLIKQLEAKQHPSLTTIKFGHSQECVDEALTLIIDLFGVNSDRIERLFKNEYESTIICTNCKQKTSQKRDKSVKIDLFTELELKTQADFCEHIRKHPSLVDKFHCEKCNVDISNVFRIESLKILREIVVVVFNKFQTKTNKWFPQELEFKGTDGRPIKYRQIGQIEQVGTMFGGHYYCNALRNMGGNLTFYNFNDSAYNLGPPSPTPNTFMIWYHMVAPPQEPAVTTIQSTSVASVSTTVNDLSAELDKLLNI